MHGKTLSLHPCYKQQQVCWHHNHPHWRPCAHASHSRVESHRASLSTAKRTEGTVQETGVHLVKAMNQWLGRRKKAATVRLASAGPAKPQEGNKETHTCIISRWHTAKKWGIQNGKNASGTRVRHTAVQHAAWACSKAPNSPAHTGSSYMHDVSTCTCHRQIPCQLNTKLGWTRGKSKGLNVQPSLRCPLPA